MSKVIIIVNAQVDGGKICSTAPVAEIMAIALKNSIMKDNKFHEVKIISAADLWSRSLNISQQDEDIIYFPLTIKLPEWFNFPAQHIYFACRDLEKRRKWVQQHFGYKTSKDNLWLGDLWLPIIFSGEKFIYGEIIGEGVIPNSYQQPYDYPSQLYSPLQKLGGELLKSIQAIPSVYLLQFKMLEQDIIFDRLWPFPATPAIASINVQQPNLFACHWLCFNNQCPEIRVLNLKDKV
ncbi:hypothetical protein [Geminocystis sp. NIES-3709]|uniref:hypothetical protein n=1 Tax=Geminocystis sp. NIES-3709 TaxID=1617448 RepID=UPI0005FC3964|nr:hypothetical protein [Geminocystis sp. NIES-3709]BAQ65954.1 hypothetical protein GM3709_2719 [Geminocystis sp. NIES-3709]